jgi:hypothetical protein
MSRPTPKPRRAECARWSATTSRRRSVNRAVRQASSRRNGLPDSSSSIECATSTRSRAQ